MHMYIIDKEVHIQQFYGVVTYNKREDNMNINIEKLRSDLKDYFGTAMMSFPMAVIELSEVENASPERLVKIALDNGIDISKYAE